VLQFVCDVVKDTGKEEYLRPFIHIGFIWMKLLEEHHTNAPEDAIMAIAVMGLLGLQLRYEHDSTTIRLYDSATTRYEMRTIRLRFEYDTTSYEELCAFEQ